MDAYRIEENGCRPECFNCGTDDAVQYVRGGYTCEGMVQLQSGDFIYPEDLCVYSRKFARHVRPSRMCRVFRCVNTSDKIFPEYLNRCAFQ